MTTMTMATSMSKSMSNLMPNELAIQNREQSSVKAGTTVSNLEQLVARSRCENRACPNA
jgi:hypothetical protein